MQAPTAPLSGRYRFKSRLDAGTKAPTWLAEDESTGKDVVASVLPTARVAALMGVVGLKHAHLAGIIEVVDNPAAEAVPDGAPASGAVIVAEHVGGKTLHQALKTARLTPAEAITLWIRLCQGVAALHAAGGAHGAISPRSIVIEPAGGRQGPILTQLLAPTSGAYCAPERLQGRGPSGADDTWALHSTLFSALTGSPPFRGDTKDQLLKSIASGQLQRLKDLGVNDEGLQELLSLGLVANTARRRGTAEQMIEALERWEPRSEGASEWEDVATVVATSTEDIARAMRDDRPAPMPSIPPVPVEAEPEPPPAPPPPPPPPPPAAIESEPAPEAMPSPYDDEDDQTTVMGSAPIEDIRRALAAPSEPPALDLPVVPPKAPPVHNPPQMPGSPFDATPPPPAPMPMAPAPAPAPSHGFPPPGSAFPPPISAFPPSIPGPPPTGIALPNDDELQIRRASRRPILVIIALVILVAIGVGVLLFLNSRGIITEAPTPRPSAAPARVASAAAVTPPETSAQQAEPPIPSAAPPVAPVAPAKPSTPEERARCVASHFEGETLRGSEDFGFLCDDKDFRGINSQVHRRLVVAGAGKVTPGMREWSALGWFELAATAVVRRACCPAGTAMPNLPTTPGECQQLGAALDDLTRTPQAKATAEARAVAYEESVLCLFRAGTPRPYNYLQRPTKHARGVLIAFLERAADRIPT